MWGGAKTIVRVQKISPKKNNNRANNKAAINNSPLRRLSGAVKNVLDSAQNGPKRMSIADIKNTAFVISTRSILEHDHHDHRLEHSEQFGHNINPRNILELHGKTVISSSSSTSTTSNRDVSTKLVLPSNRLCSLLLTFSLLINLLSITSLILAVYVIDLYYQDTTQLLLNQTNGSSIIDVDLPTNTAPTAPGVLDVPVLVLLYPLASCIFIYLWESLHYDNTLSYLSNTEKCTASIDRYLDLLKRNRPHLIMSSETFHYEPTGERRITSSSRRAIGFSVFYDMSQLPVGFERYPVVMVDITKRDVKTFNKQTQTSIRAQQRTFRNERVR